MTQRILVFLGILCFVAAIDSLRRGWTIVGLWNALGSALCLATATGD